MSSRKLDDLINELVAQSVNRRRFLRQAGVGAASLSAMSLLSGCFGGGDDKKSDDSKVIPKGEIGDLLVIANWPLYIDIDEKTKRRPTIENFKKEFGVNRVRYVEEVNDNVEFFGEVRQQYANGNSGGRDIHVVTDWMAGRMKQLKYVQRLDKTELPNVQANLIDRLRNPPFDPKREYSVPWQSGMTGLVYRRDLVGGKLSSVNDIFDPRFKGKVTMLTEMRDTVGLTMAGMGKDPETFKGTADALEAIEKIDKATKDGHIRRFTGNEYTRDLTSGDAWVVYGWSGDAVQLKADNKNIEFLQPEEGFHLFTDNMQIPVGAPQAFTAQKFMNYVYDPEVQANIAAYVNYVTPVKGVQEVLRKTDPELAENELIFPTDEVLDRAFIFRQLAPAEEAEIDKAFQAAIGA